MSIDNLGGPVTELVLSCSTEASGTVNIRKGDALKLTGPYTVTNVTDAEDPIFGQALADAAENDALIPVLVRGVAVLAYTGAAPAVNGAAGIVASATGGNVKAPATGNGRGINLKVDEALTQVHVLL